MMIIWLSNDWWIAHTNKQTNNLNEWPTRNWAVDFIHSVFIFCILPITVPLLLLLFSSFLLYHRVYIIVHSIQANYQSQTTTFWSDLGWALCSEQSNIIRSFQVIRSDISSILIAEIVIVHNVPILFSIVYYVRPLLFI